jgi:hypothetical protein
MRRRLKLYEAYVLHRMEVTGEVFDTIDSLSAFIERELKLLIKSTYGVAVPGVPAAAETAESF